MASLLHRARRARLWRRLAALTGAARRKVARREGWRERAAASAAIRAALAAAGIDPAQNSAMRYFAGWNRAPAPIGDNPDLRRADAAFIAHDPLLAGRERLAAKAAARAPLFAGRMPSERHNSPLDWYAWALAVLAG